MRNMMRCSKCGKFCGEGSVTYPPIFSEFKAGKNPISIVIMCPKCWLNLSNYERNMISINAYIKPKRLIYGHWRTLDFQYDFTPVTPFVSDNRLTTQELKDLNSISEDIDKQPEEQPLLTTLGSFGATGKLNSDLNAEPFIMKYTDPKVDPYGGKYNSSWNGHVWSTTPSSNDILEIIKLKRMVRETRERARRWLYRTIRIFKNRGISI